MILRSALRLATFAFICFISLPGTSAHAGIEFGRDPEEVLTEESAAELTERYELRTVWVWEKEIQLQIHNRDRGLLINLIRGQRDLLKAEVLVYATQEEEFRLTDAELSKLIQEAADGATKVHFRFFADEDEFFGMQIDFRKRLHENGLRTHEKFLPKLKAFVRGSHIRQTTWCTELLLPS